MATVTKSTVSNRFVLDGVSFKTYQSLRADLDRSGRHVRLAFDRGTLEIMSPISYEHERGSFLLSQLISAISVGLRLPIVGAKSTTFAREDLDGGVEPDECFYIANEPRVRFAREINIPTDPPPDLAIEVDVSRSSLDKMSIYAALGVGEFWRLEDGKIHIFGLDEERAYREVNASLSFPFLTRDEIDQWLTRRDLMDQTTWFVAILDWVRDEIAPRFDDQAGR
jgi:Uma2 family endonuclease